MYETREFKPNNYIDAEIASQIMEWSIVKAGEEEWLDKAILGGARFPIFAIWPQGGTEVIFDDVPVDNKIFHPSSIFSDAMEAMEKLRRKGYKLGMRGDLDGWHATVFCPDGSEAEEEDPLNAALALSKAMLAATRKLKESSPERP